MIIDITIPEYQLAKISLREDIRYGLKIRNFATARGRIRARIALLRKLDLALRNTLDSQNPLGTYSELRKENREIRAFGKSIPTQP